MNIHDLLALAIEKKASDLHLTEKEPPILRIDGALLRTDLPVLTRDFLKTMIASILNESQKKAFEQRLGLDFSVAFPGMDRFRVKKGLWRQHLDASLRKSQEYRI
jgi:twitching motility protein PilT